MVYSSPIPEPSNRAQSYSHDAQEQTNPLALTIHVTSSA